MCVALLCAEPSVWINLHRRLVRDQNLSSECIGLGRNLRQHAEERLEIDLWNSSHTRDCKMSAYISKSGIGAGRGSREVIT